MIGVCGTGREWMCAVGVSRGVVSLGGGCVCQHGGVSVLGLFPGAAVGLGQLCAALGRLCVLVDGERRMGSGDRTGVMHLVGVPQ